MIIAVDFDGTIVEHQYPQIGPEIPFAIETLKKLQQDHHRLILWTVRKGKELEDAVAFCKERGLEFYAHNANYPYEEESEKEASRKLSSIDMYIDDRNVGGLPDWGLIYQYITNPEAVKFHPSVVEKKRKKNIFIRFGEWLDKAKKS